MSKYIEEVIQKLHVFFCTPTDMGTSVQFTSDTLEDKEGYGVTLDEFIEKEFQSALQKQIEMIEGEAKKMKVEQGDDDRGYCKYCTYHIPSGDCTCGPMNSTIDDILSILNQYK